MKILITGANGFVGQALVGQLKPSGHHVVPGVQRSYGLLGEIVVGVVDGATQWAEAVAGCRAVVHLAARVHVMHEMTTDPLEAYRQTNVAGSLNLARQAAAAGVRRFIYVSTVKVNGEFTGNGQAFAFDDIPAPQDPYGVSKAEAEAGLREIAVQTGMEVVIIRPPLVYGPGVKANFATLVRWVRKGVPLPLGAIHNQRSLVALGNLVDLITTCLDHPEATNQTFMVSDGHDVSTSELLRGLSYAMECPVRLLSVPQSWLVVGLRLIGREDWGQRLCGNLQVDIFHTCKTLGWRPPVSVAEGLRRTVAK